MTYTKMTRWSVECDGRCKSGARCGRVEYGPTKRETFDAARALGWIILPTALSFCEDHRSQAREAR